MNLQEHREEGEGEKTFVGKHVHGQAWKSRREGRGNGRKPTGVTEVGMAVTRSGRGNVHTTGRCTLWAVVLADSPNYKIP